LKRRKATHPFVKLCDVDDDDDDADREHFVPMKYWSNFYAGRTFCTEKLVIIII